jgi:hypothetical protein
MSVLPTVRPASGRVSVLAVGMTLMALMIAPAWAQIGMPSTAPGAGNIATGRNIQAKPEKPPEPAPDAIPGARAREPAAPATHAAADMQPTDALFDAINRGDIAAARDALNRGADLSGVNVLGMTPMELSVDLGRNDISFLLLSMRGEDGGRGSRAVGRDSAPPTLAGKTAQGAKPVASARSGPGRAAQTANTIIPAKRVTTPKLFANDGGAPVPNAGFLGFDSRSASN